MHKLYFTILSWLLTVSGLLVSCKQENTKEFVAWRVYRGDEGSNAYSTLSQINKKNVELLKVAWIYRTGDKSDFISLECSPIIINNILYGISPRLKTFALDAKTGKELWVFDPFERNSKDGGVCRGLNYWKSGDAERIFMFAGSNMIALDATTGKRVMNFGDSGYVNLNKGLRTIDGTQKGDVGNTSPGVIYKDLIIIGSSVGEDYESSPGHIRAYDVRTGKMKWIFHTIPAPGQLGADTWPNNAYKTAGGCNAWSGLSLDSKRGIVFAATGAPAFDFHGGERIGQNLFGNCVLALDAATGKLIWHFQVSHHDLWDYDLPAPPNLVTLNKEGKSIDAVAQITKQGYVFLFDRETGEPIFHVEEKPVPGSAMPDDQAWPTQPVPIKPLPLCRQKFDESIITDISPEAHEFVLNEARKYTWGEAYLPTSQKGIIQMPGLRGGAEWSGASVDVETGIMYVGINDIPNIVQLVDRKEEDLEMLTGMPMINAGKILYQKNCAVCHGNDLKGNNSFPPLLNVQTRLKPTDVESILQKPRGLMPAFNNISQEDKNAIIDYLFNRNTKQVYKGNKSMDDKKLNHAQKRKRYSIQGYVQLKDQNGYPGVKPPWGTLNAVDLNTGDLIWRIPLGEFPELVTKGHGNTGTQLFGGGIVTAGGLIFMGATQDEKFRAIDKTTGKILWEYQLPCGGYATPATYEVDGKQFVVIAAGGGGRQRTKAGDYYFAFALP